MKKIYLLSLSLLTTALTLNARTPCDAGRYSTDLFPNVTVTSNVTYGANSSFTGANTILKMDIYEPTGDTETARPMIIWAHGGSFIGGSKTDGDVVALSNAFAKKGYVCASIDYRVGMWPIDSVNSIKAVMRAVQDMRASVRFFYRDRAEGNNYSIDTNNIYIGGSSAGAVTSLHLAYLDSTCQVSEYVPSADIIAMGGIEGESGNKCYSSNVQGVINLCGALATYAWIDSEDPPLCSLHGNNDGTVPYNRGVANVSGIDIMLLDGSRMLYEHTQAIGFQHNFYTYTNAGHVPYGVGASAPAYMDTTINFVSDFLVDQLGCTETVLQPANSPVETSTLYPYTPCTGNSPLVVDCSDLGLNDIDNSISMSVYPNPSSDQMTVVFGNGIFVNEVVLLDLSGRIINSYDVNSSSLIIRKNNLKAGTYILKSISDKGVISTHKIIFQ